MPSLLLGLRGYFIGGLLALVVAAGGWYTYHERHVEHVKDVAAETKVVNAVKSQDVVIAAEAVKDTSSAIQIFKAVVQLPAVPDIGLVCRSASSHPVPAPAKSNGVGAGPSGQPVPGDVFDPSSDLLAIARSSEARIRELLAENTALRAEMTRAAGVHQ
jgi:hypothetical protein